MAIFPEFFESHFKAPWMFLTIFLQIHARTSAIIFNTLNVIGHTDEYKTH